ncbi:MAG: leucyl aminopeptidase [Alphaproteobacteria bacterium]|nr:leucyl aminopeptidase [Alphaproteobacteria bacterium]
MKITFLRHTIPATGAAALTVAAGGKLGPLGVKLDKKTGGAITRAMRGGKFEGKKGQALVLLAPAKTRLARLVLVGIGKPEDACLVTLQNAGGGAVAALNGKESAATLAVDDHKGMKLAAGEAAAHAAFGAQLRSYRFDKYLTKDKAKPALKSLAVAAAAQASARASYAALGRIAEGVFTTRDLVSEPANVIYPESMAAVCRTLKEFGVKVEVLNEKQMAKLGMGALLGVAQGSVRPPRLVSMVWEGAPRAKNKQPLALVGKGVTFDTGGISLKPPPGMGDMKWDMAGAGAVIGAMKAIAANKVKANVVGIVGLVENMPDGNAQRPGDIVKSMSGQTIEVLNTDAEGRLVLADAVWYAQVHHKAHTIVDLATLTGAILVTFGDEYAGLFSNDDALSEDLTKAGKAVDEKLWRLPLGDAYDRDLNCDAADMQNIGAGKAGSIVAAQFIQRFIKKSVNWAHLDIAGMAWLKAARPTAAKGASAYGVRLLHEFVAARAEK